MNLILDTSAWYAYLFKEDKFHHQAKTIVTVQKPSLAIPYPVIEELSAIIHGRKGKRIVLSHIYQGLLLSEHAVVTYINDKQDGEIWQFYQETRSQIDYVDASVIWLSRKLDLPIFTFDRHFQNLDLPLIPRIL